MIVLPDILLRKRLLSELKRGKTLRTEVIFNGKPHFKRLILLNKNFLGDNIFFIFTTSNVDWYLEHDEFEPVKGNYIYVPKGKTAVNLDDDMVINCREVYFNLTKEDLLGSLKYKKLDFLGEIPEEIMAEIDKIISKSRLIAPKIKKHII